MKREWNIRTVYLYLVCFVTLMMVIFGTVDLIRSVVTFLYPPPTYTPGPLDLKLRVQDDPSLTTELLKEQARFDEERQRQQQRYDQARRLAQAFSLLLVALPIYVYHWRRIQQECDPPVRT